MNINGLQFSLSCLAPSPLRSRLSDLVSSGIRYQLRRLLNAPPPPATTPSHNDMGWESSYAAAGCRSKVNYATN